MEQAKHLANLKFAFRHIALMADTHQGMGMPIGGVLAAKNAVVPNAVGVDIGCGMCAARTNLTSLSSDKLRSILSDIRHNIPVGFTHHPQPCEAQMMPDAKVESRNSYPIIYEEYDSARKQLGTLGGGNHFIEIQMGGDGFVWVMIHSGSRNLGKKVADYHNKVARGLNERLQDAAPCKWDLAHLPWGSEEAEIYMREMTYCLEFARLNRLSMQHAVKGMFYEHTGASFDEPLDIHHNYAAIEHHFGEDVVIHRKGATSAKEGQRGIIPGSQGSMSHIVVGKGDPESFVSCAHGAGRKMGRKQAIRELDMDKEIKALESKGIIHSVLDKASLDEAPGAYKDIDMVMAEQADLVEIILRLEPMAVVKG